MSIEEQIATRLKDAMRSKDQRVLGVLRMIKTQAGTAKTAAGFSGKTDDPFWTDVIAKYVKQQKKALAEFEKGGDRAADQLAQLRFEIDYLAPFLPSLLDESQVRELVRQAIADTGAVGAKMAGRVTGAVMKAHRDQVDAQVVKRIAEEELG